jgi:hypothetical protein
VQLPVQGGHVPEQLQRHLLVGSDWLRWAEEASLPLHQQCHPHWHMQEGLSTAD